MKFITMQIGIGNAKSHPHKDDVLHLHTHLTEEEYKKLITAYDSDDFYYYIKSISKNE